MNDDFQEILEILKKEYREELKGKFIQDKSKVGLIEFIFGLLGSITEHDDIRMRIDEPFIGSIDIIIEGKEISIKHTALFAKLLDMADVTEIVTANNGIQFNLTFYGTSKKVSN